MGAQGEWLTKTLGPSLEPRTLQVQEYFGDFVALEAHHFLVPLPRPHLALQVRGALSAVPGCSPGRVWFCCGCWWYVTCSPWLSVLVSLGAGNAGG